MKLRCKLFGHKFTQGSACIRCNHDPLANLRSLIESANESAFKDEMRKLCSEMEDALQS